jgi:DNA invertase Pin-like site-specific DNA recombinase
MTPAAATRPSLSDPTKRKRSLQRLLDQLRAGDTLVVWRLDRLARSTRDLLDITETIHGADASFQFISEPWADTTTNAGKMILTVFAGIAEFERGLIRERTGVGTEPPPKRTACVSVVPGSSTRSSVR